MVTIRLVNISNYILKNVSLNIGFNKIHVIYGPNGAGKTTLLKVIAGLTEYKGHVYFDDRLMDSVPPWKRGIGYLPQNNALFPHMNVYENMLFGLRNNGLDPGRASKRVDEYLELLDISRLKNKYPGFLSSGEKKLVALARVLVLEPKILLLDEPFSNLHYNYKIRIMNMIKYIHRKLNNTIIIVSHILDESLILGDEYSILVNGLLKYNGGLTGLLNAINNELEYLNVLRCRVSEEIYGEQLMKITCKDIELVSLTNRRVGDEVLVSILADKISIHRNRGSCSMNCLNGKVSSKRNLGKNLWLLKVRVGETIFNVLTDQYIKLDSNVYIEIPIRNIMIYKV